MSMLGEQIKELRTLASELEQFIADYDGFTREEDAMLVASMDTMREAADTIDSLRNRLQTVSETCHWEYPQSVTELRGYCECSACGYRLYEGSGIHESEWTYCPNCQREFKEVGA